MRKLKRNLVLLSGLFAVFLLAGCSNSRITANSTGFWDHYIVWNLVQLIRWISNLFGGNYGWGIIIITIIVRIIILPLMFYQMKSMRKMTEIQPQLKKLQQKYAGTDRQGRLEMQQETQKLYAEAGVNPFASMLPLLVQMPVLIALYQAIYRSDILKTGHFLWMQLGAKDPYFVMPVLAALFTWLTSKLNMMSQPEQNSVSTVMVWGMPVFILVMAINLPAALSLYWVIGNAFSAGQTMLINNPYKINAERKAKQEAEKRRQRALAKAKRRALKGRNKK